PVAYSSVLLSMGSAYLAAVLVAAALGPLAGIVGSEADLRVLLVLLFLPIGFALIHPRVLAVGLGVVRRVTGRRLDLAVPEWSQSARIVLRQVPSWFLI